MNTNSSKSSECVSPHYNYNDNDSGERYWSLSSVSVDANIVVVNVIIIDVAIVFGVDGP